MDIYIDHLTQIELHIFVIFSAFIGALILLMLLTIKKQQI